jgi:hypothetical protein
LYLAFAKKVKKLINFIIGAIIGVVVLYMISIILAAIVLGVAVIVNRIIAYRKKHRRFTDWEYKYARSKNEMLGNSMQIRRTFYFERLDKLTNIVEVREEVKITPIRDYDNFKAEEMAEWLAYKNYEKKFMDIKLKSSFTTHQFPLPY